MTAIGRRILFLVLAAALSAPAAGVRAGGPVLVELFTSQGCSSCPPADRLLGELAEREDVLPLSLHVDYWDYLGWRDTFGLVEATARQQAYRDAWDARYVYTPQMVVGGRIEVRGPKPDELEAAIAEARAAEGPTWVELTADGAILRCRVGGAPEGAVVWMARYAASRTVAIARGENAGKLITYHNVVESIEPLGPAPADGMETLLLQVPEPGTGIAIWVQEPEGGRVLAVARHMPTS